MNEAPDFILFLGRFHPLVVHLPIGFLIFAFLLEILGRKKKFEATKAAIPLALFLGFASSVVACVLGYMLSLSGDYNNDALDTHFWFGLATTALTLLAWLIRVEIIKLPNKNKVRVNISTLTLVVILLSATGHYGGNLTHGSDYLTKFAPFNKKEKRVLATIDKVDDAIVFDYLAQPILENKCASCHNESKKKGGLSFQDSISIVKGGKSGATLIAGNALESEMIKRVLLNPDHEDFMPPEGKTPLTREEIDILTYWINQADANFSSKVSTVETSEDIKQIASKMLGFKGTHKKGQTDLPTVNKVSEEALRTIKAEGFVLKELVFDSGLYEAVLPENSITENNASALDIKLEKLSKIKNNIIWLYLENNQLKDKHLKQISQFENVQKLVINRNNITDTGLYALRDHKSLNSLNVYNTSITKASLETFSSMKNLQKVYAWHTTINKNDLNEHKPEDGPEIILGN